MSASAYQGKYFSIDLDEQGVEYIRSGDEVLVVAINDQGEVLLTREPAPALGGQPVLILPGGSIEDGEEMLVSANRELQEETGLAAEQLERLGEVHGFSKYLTTRSFIVLARRLRASRLPGDEDYPIDLEYVPLDRVERLVDLGRLKDARAIAGLSMAKNFLHRQETWKGFNKLEEYKLFVEDTSRITDRRLTVTNVYVAVNSLLLSGIAFLVKDATLQHPAWLLTIPGILIAGIVICLFWSRHILKYKMLVDFRINQLREMENDLDMANSHRMYHAEDILYPRDASGKALPGKALNFSDFEQYLPRTYSILYGLSLIGLTLAIIFGLQ